jgi:N-terminal half of MaoC dehydratase
MAGQPLVMDEILGTANSVALTSREEEAACRVTRDVRSGLAVANRGFVTGRRRLLFEARPRAQPTGRISSQWACGFPWRVGAGLPSWPPCCAASAMIVAAKPMVQEEGDDRVEDWQAEWQPMIAAVGTVFGGEQSMQEAADDVEKGFVRRFLEPLEFDCPLHHDVEVAKRHGYDDILCPVSAILTCNMGPQWSPGTTIFTSADRDAQPERVTTRSNPSAGPMPRMEGFFATDMDMEFVTPLVVGDRLHSGGGRRLLSCEPKETKVGRGAFLKWQSEIKNQRNEVVALVNTGIYMYHPHAGPTA